MGIRMWATVQCLSALPVWQQYCHANATSQPCQWPTMLSATNTWQCSIGAQPLVCHRTIMHPVCFCPKAKPKVGARAAGADPPLRPAKKAKAKASSLFWGTSWHIPWDCLFRLAARCDSFALFFSLVEGLVRFLFSTISLCFLSITDPLPDLHGGEVKTSEGGFEYERQQPELRPMRTMGILTPMLQQCHKLVLSTSRKWY